MTLKQAFLAAAFIAPGLGFAPAVALAADPVIATPDVIAPAAAPVIPVIFASAAAVPLPSAAAAAPMPDADAGAPVIAQDETPQVQPAFYSTEKEFRGDGFSEGSTRQDVHASIARPAAGLALNVPLD